VVATVKNEHLGHNRILSVVPIDWEGAARGPSFLALDVVDAGPGDTVLVNREGGGARIVFRNDRIPLQAVVVAIVEGIHVDRDLAGAGR
jgi:microcompartment protein CcmK/EutM